MILDNKELIFISPFPNKGLKKKALLWNQKFCLKEKSRSSPGTLVAGLSMPSRCLGKLFCVSGDFL